MLISLPFILDVSNKNIRFELTKILARFHPQVTVELQTKNFRSETSLIPKTVIFVAFKPV